MEPGGGAVIAHPPLLGRRSRVDRKVLKRYSTRREGCFEQEVFGGLCSLPARGASGSGACLYARRWAGRSDDDSSFPRDRAWQCLLVRGFVLAIVPHSPGLRTAASARTKYEHELDFRAIWKETRTLKCKHANWLNPGMEAELNGLRERKRSVVPAGCVETASADSAPGLASRMWLWRGSPLENARG